MRAFGIVVATFLIAMPVLGLARPSSSGSSFSESPEIEEVENSRAKSGLSASFGFGHQACLAEGGAVCTTTKHGVHTNLAIDYEILSWLEAGIDLGYGHFAESDGYETLSSLLNITATYSWREWSLIGNGGVGFFNAWFERAERGAGEVVYDYSTFAAIRIGGGLGYEINDDYRLSILSRLLLGGKGELCPTIAGVEGDCRSNQDLIDLFVTSARLTYRF